jgi:hypothetical protein
MHLGIPHDCGHPQPCHPPVTAPASQLRKAPQLRHFALRQHQVLCVVGEGYLRNASRAGEPTKQKWGWNQPIGS